MAKIDINQGRLEYLLALFDFESLEELANVINVSPKSLQSPLTKTTLQKIDKIFKKGLAFYTNPNPIKDVNSSILFRRKHAQDDLDIGDKQLVSEVEAQINYINAIAKLSGFGFNTRKLQSFSLKDNPQEVAYKMRFLLPQKINDDKKFLQNFIENLSSQNILVLEKITRGNAAFRSNLCGFFVEPNIIALNKQGSRKREIFTLSHELGHYLLNKEHVDKDILNSHTDKEEKWCNEFAFYLLIGDSLPQLASNAKDISLTNQNLLKISQERHLSRLALFYYYAKSHKITWERYKQLKNE